MSLSKETQEYHLTPNGWITGSFYGDGATEINPIPSDRVLTIHCTVERTSFYSKTSFYDEIE